MIFQSHSEVIGLLPAFTLEDVKREPMFYHADRLEVSYKGGDITRAFIKHLDADKDWVIDSRVHMLMPGWYPCIPGWHHDDVPRSTADGQPNYANPEYHAEHILCVVDVGTGSLTQFLEGEVEVADPGTFEHESGTVYGGWNAMLNAELDSRKFNYYATPLNRFYKKTVQSREVIKLDAHTFHRGMPATGNGWRMFIRATTNTQEPVRNEWRRQVQVYLPALEAGW